MTEKELKRLWIRQCHLGLLYCWLCLEQIDDESEISKDHIIPKSKGGKNQCENYMPAHKRCNSLRGNTMIEQYREQQRKQK